MGGQHIPALMILASTTTLNISIILVLIVFLIVCVLMVLVILMQRPKQEGLGAAFGSGVTDQVFGARTTNVLQKGTAYFAGAFFLLSLLLGILIGHRNKSESLLTNKSQPAINAPAAPAVPNAGADKKSLLEELPQDDAPAPVVVPDSVPPVPAPVPPVPTPPANPAGE